MKRPKLDRTKAGLIAGLLACLIFIALAWPEIWRRGEKINGLEAQLVEAKAQLAEAQERIAELEGSPMAYLLLYRRATLARFERIEPRWDEIMEATWRASIKHGVPAEITIAKMELESFFNPDAVGSKGEMGLMQIYPPAWPQFNTARGFDIGYNADFGCQVFAYCMKTSKGDIREALRRYNGLGSLPDGIVPYADRVLNGRAMTIPKSKIGGGK